MLIEKIFHGSKRYWFTLTVLVATIVLGVMAYMVQYNEGLGVTGMSRDIPWGFYIAQLTFLVGVAASAVMVVLPYYLHDYKTFGKVVVLGEFLAIAAVVMCVAFVVVDIGQPGRALNVVLHASPNSVLFWDVVVLFGYLMLNLVIARVTFGAEYRGMAPPKWIKPVILLSIPWAVSIHTVTAFLYSGLGARPFWLSAILAPRFLASAFAGGPALLLILCLVARKFSKFDVGDKAIKTLSKIIAYAMVANVFFIALEFFTVYYSDMPHHTAHFEYLYFGLEGASNLPPFMLVSTLLALVSLLVLLVPAARNNTKLLVLACVTVIASIWIDKGMGMVIAGFNPTPLEYVRSYWPTYIEGAVSIGIYAIGATILLLLFKIGLSAREEHLQTGKGVGE